MNKFKFEVVLDVADVWVADGFGGSKAQNEQRLREVIKDNMLGWSYDHEFQVTVNQISAPLPSKVKGLQNGTIKIR